MHTHSIQNWTHDHVFLGEHHIRNERRTWVVVALTVVMMFAEIIGGVLYGSMALLADGWHMGTHAFAIGIAASAYRFARRHAHDSKYTFGTGKLGDLAAFASANFLAMVAVLIAFESATRLFSPIVIRFGEAIIVASVGLAVNLVSAWLLFDSHSHDHAHDDDHEHWDERTHHHKQDINLRAAYLHVLADALTSILAIVALLGGRYFGLNWLDPVIGIIGALVIVHWAWGLIRSSSATLLDTVPDPAMLARIRGRLETDGDRVSDLHLWRVGPGHNAAVISIVTDRPASPASYKQRLSDLAGLSHVTVEVEMCPGKH